MRVYLATACLAFCLLLSISSGAGAAEPQDELMALNGRLQQWLEQGQLGGLALGRESAAIESEIAALRERLKRGPTGTLRKLEQLHQLYELAVAAASRPEKRKILAKSLPGNDMSLAIESVESVGARCAEPLHLPNDTRLNLRLSEANHFGDAVWVRWQAPMDGYFALRAEGGSVDSALSVIEECGDALSDTNSNAKSDDVIGLDPVVTLNADHAGQVFLIKLSNRSKLAGDVAIGVKAAVQISGRVIDAATNAGIYDTQVMLFEAQSGALVGSSYTDSQGNYVIGPWYNIADVPITVRTLHQASWNAAPKYVDQAWDGKPCSSGSSSIAACPGAMSFVLSTGESRSGVNFALTEGHSIQGHLTDSVSGKSLAGAYVSLWQGSNRVRETQTDANGNYRFGAAQFYAVRLYANSPDYAGKLYPDTACTDVYACIQTNQGVELNSSTATVNADLSLDAWSFLEVDLSVDGVSYFGGTGPTFTLFDSSGNQRAAAVTHYGAGRYHVGPLSEGEYSLRAHVPGQTFKRLYPDVDCAAECEAEQLNRSGKITIRNKGERVRVSLDLRKLPVISGQVSDQAGVAVPQGAVVMLLRPGQTADYPTLSASTDISGRYELRGIEPGSYYVFVSARRYVDQLHDGINCESRNPLNQCDIGQAIQVGPESELSRTIDFRLQGGRVVSGQFTSLGQPLPGGTWFSSFSVRLMKASLESIPANLTVDAATGRYSLSDFVPGTYFLGAAVDGYFVQLSPAVLCPNTTYYFETCPIASAEPIDLRLADRTVDFDLRPFGSRTVSVSSMSTGAPIAGVHLDLWNTNGKSLGGARTNAQGRAIIKITGFTQDVRLSTDNEQGYIDEVYDNRMCAIATSAFKGTCALAGAATIRLPDNSGNGAEINISLNSEAEAALVFRSDFE